MSEATTLLQPKKKATMPRLVSLEDYFRAEEKSLYKNEYHNGTVVKRQGVPLINSRLICKAMTLFYNFIEGNDFDYIVSNSDTKIRINAFNKIVYPDAVVICEKPEYFEGREDTIINPSVIVEVSRSSVSSPPPQTGAT